LTPIIPLDPDTRLSVLEDVPLHEESLSRMFYSVEDNGYSTSLLDATLFKSLEVATAVATALGKDEGVEVTRRPIESCANDSSATPDKVCRRGTSPRSCVAWRGMVAYLEAAAEAGDSELIAVAVDDVMKAMTAQITVEYLKERDELGDGVRRPS
jgi:hypothetical protein